tara:strand:+ start:1097 stop:2014 length:918 start_codon:yes stop_codon:yes gene_type:complete
MNIHERKTSSRNKSTCGYCRERGHNQYQCPHVKGDWENFLSKWRFPVDDNGNPLKRGYNMVAWHGQNNYDPLTMTIYNNGFASWFRNCRKAYIVQKQRGFNLNATAKRSVSSAPKKCGFCGSTNHTRRKCPTMKQFLKDCYKANENWRRAAYHEIVQNHGLSVGAVVKINRRQSYWHGEETSHTAIITGINWDTINVFTACNKRSESARSPLNIKVLVDGKTEIISNVHEIFTCVGENGKADSWHGVKLTKVITHSPTPLDPEWITSYKESFETLTKKRSMEQLKNGMASEYSPPNLVAHVSAWV